MIFLKSLIQEYILFAEARHWLILRALKSYFVSPAFRVNVLVEIMRQTHNPYIKKIIRKKLMIKYGIEVGVDSIIGERLRIEHYNGIVIGGNSVIGDDCIIYHQVTLGQKKGKYPQIGNRVIIYPGAKILGDIYVDDDSIIGANAVVVKDVLKKQTVVGIPAFEVKGASMYAESEKKSDI